MSNPALWFVYLLRCADGSYYSGVTTDPARRQHEHNNSIKGARYTRSRRPVEMVWIQDCADRSEALRLERLLKKQSHGCKRLLTQGARD